MDKFKEKPMIKKGLLVKKTWYDWLINFESHKKRGRCEGKHYEFFKTNTTKAYTKRMFANVSMLACYKPTHVSNAYNSGKEPRNPKNTGGKTSIRK